MAVECANDEEVYKGEIMKRQHKWFLECAVVIVLTLQGQGQVFSTYDIPPPPPPVVITQTIIQTPPKYGLWEGVDVAIGTLEKLGRVISVDTVLDELKSMRKRNEVKFLDDSDFFWHNWRIMSICIYSSIL